MALSRYRLTFLCMTASPRPCVESTTLRGVLFLFDGNKRQLFLSISLQQVSQRRDEECRVTILVQYSAQSAVHCFCFSIQSSCTMYGESFSDYTVCMSA